MDSSSVNKEIRRVIWPALRNTGFTQFTARSAWRYVPGKIDVVNFQSFNSYLARGVGCTTYSFALNLGCSFDTIPRLKTVEEKKGYLRPKEWECHFRLRLHKTIRQPELERTDTWYVDPAGRYLNSAVEDVKEAILETGLGWFSRFNDSNEVLRTLLDDAMKMDGTHGFGNKRLAHPGFDDRLYRMFVGDRLSLLPIIFKRPCFLAASTIWTPISVCYSNK